MSQAAPIRDLRAASWRALSRAPGHGAIEVVPVEGWRDRLRFIKVPWTIYADDPCWVPPLVLERFEHLSRRNPFFSWARSRFWIARRDGVPVGRISAQVNRLHLEKFRDATGHFGFLEAIDDPEVFAVLLQTAERWLAEQGMKRILGPFSLSINDECGLLIDGFDTPPMFMMPHGKPYYDGRVQEQGYAKAKDTVAYIRDLRIRPPAVMEASVRRALAGRVRVRPVRLDRLREEIELIRDIFNDAWAENWNAIPFTTEELAGIGSALKLFAPPEFVQIGEIDGKPAAMLVVVPNLNELIRDLNGRLFPANWARLLWRLKRRRPATARVPLMGLRREYHGSTLGMTVVFCLFEVARQAMLSRGVERAELSWALEDNRPMRHIKERIGARVYKTYRMYEKALVPAAALAPVEYRA